MDKLDKEILRLLQIDATQSVADIAEQIGLSTTPCWRRIQSLEKQGIINKRVVLLNPEKIGLGMTVFVQVKAAKHDSVWLKTFAEHAANIEQVVEFYRMSGEYDYMLYFNIKKKIPVKDIFYMTIMISSNNVFGVLIVECGFTICPHPN